MTADVVVLIPVLRRPHRVQPVLDSVMASTDRARVLFIATRGDEAEIQAAQDAGAELLLVNQMEYAPKINQGVRETSEPLVFLGADDLHFHPGWLEAAEALLSDTVGLVGTQDQCNGRVIRGEHATHMLLARWYCELGTIDEPGKVLHEGYLHEWVDDECVATARHRGAWAFADDSIVEHLHPDVLKAPVDALYADRRRRMWYGRRIFDRRKHLWTPEA